MKNTTTPTPLILRDHEIKHAKPGEDWAANPFVFVGEYKVIK